MAPPRVGDLQKRLGLRGAIIRFGERWKTDEIKNLENDTRVFYQKYEPFKAAGTPYPPEFEPEIEAILQHHGPLVWPDGPRSTETEETDGQETSPCPWLFPAQSIPEYPEDIYFSQDYLK